MLQGIVEKIKEDWFVRYESFQYSEPVKVITRWKIIKVQGKIEEGLVAQYGEMNIWHTYNGYGNHTQFLTNKEGTIEQIPIPCPKVRKGIRTRWMNERWEKELKQGWVPA